MRVIATLKPKSSQYKQVILEKSVKKLQPLVNITRLFAKVSRSNLRQDQGKGKAIHDQQFLSAQQIQSFFSRKAARIRLGEASGNEYEASDLEAAQDQQALDDARQLVLDEVELLHPIVFDTYNLRDMYKENKLCKLTVCMLKTVSSHFDLTPETAANRRKAPYLSAIEQLIRACPCGAGEK